MRVTYSTPDPNRRTLLSLLGWLGLCFSAAGGAVFVSPDGWYERLVKPPWNPPSWIFAPVWSLLYVLMAVAAWRIGRVGGGLRPRRALRLFVAQLLLNAVWTPLFFGLHQIGAALVVILLLGATLAATVAAFGQVQPRAAWLLAPYLAWVTFAAALNAALWRLNP